MTTGYGDTDLGIDELDDLLNAEVITKPEPRPTFSRPTPTDKQTGVSLDAQAWSGTDATALQTVFRRLVRTTGPFIVSDLFALMICGLMTWAILSFISPTAATLVGWASPIALFPLIVTYWLSGLYSEIWVHPVIELRQLSHVNTVALLTAATVGILIPPFPLWCVMAWLCTVFLVPLCRVVLRRIVGRFSWWGYPTLVIATGDGMDSIAGALLKARYSGLRPVLLTDPEAHCRTSLLPVVNDLVILKSLLRARGIRHAVISLPEFSNTHLLKMLDRYGGLIPHLLVWSDAFTLPALWGASCNCGRLSGLEVRNHLLLATLQFMKRIVDITVSLMALLFGLPLFAVIGILVKLTDGGSMVFGHTRIGRHGRLFTAWKFRSMNTNGDEILRKHLANNPAAREEWERNHKLQDDPRVTRLGRILRKTSLDELPQVWNVLKGDMSLVGPRPIVKDEVRYYGEVYRMYTNVKPGITGLWQVSGRTDISYDDRVRLDEFYVRHWSPWLDIYILAKTVVALVNRSGAY